MAFLYLTHQGAVVRRRGDALVVEADGQVLAELESHRLESLCIFGRVHLTVPAMELLLARGIETAFLTRSGRLKGQLTPASRRARSSAGRWSASADGSVTASPTSPIASNPRRCDHDIHRHLLRRYRRPKAPEGGEGS